MMNRNRKQDKDFLQIVDIICIFISFYIAIWIRHGTILVNLRGTGYDSMLILSILCYIFTFNLLDFYSGFFKRGFFDELVSIFQMNMALALLTIGILFFLKEASIYSRLFFATFLVFNVLVDYIARQYFKVLLLAYFKKSGGSSKVMIITTWDRINAIINRMKREREWEYEISSIAIVDRDMMGESIGGIPVVANRDSLLEVATKAVVDEVFVCVPYAEHLDLEEIILAFENIGITVNLSISTFDLHVKEKMVATFYGYHVITFTTKVFNKASLVFKRSIDILGAIAGLAITGIVSLFVAPAILLESPGPLFFSQTRVGKNGRKFKIYKFRSMYKDAEARKKELLARNEMKGHMFKMTDDPRITRVGRFIRKTSIDELPQFFNVLKGDMSLVGTRPPTEDEFLQYEGRHKRRLSLRPGITGLWQVSGRSEIENFEDVVRLDLKYIDHWSLLLDFNLLIRTVGVVLFGRGAR